MSFIKPSFQKLDFMKQISFMSFLLLLGFFTFSQDGRVINDPHAEKRNVQGFHAIRISSGIDLYLSQGEEAVAVSASDPDTKNRIRTEVVDGVLKIYMENSGLHWSWGNKKLRAYVSARNLDQLTASGGSDVFLQGTIKLETLAVSLSGGSDFKGQVDIRTLSLHQSGGSDVNISGVAGSLKVDASGGSDLHGYDLSTETCDIEASGGSDARITVNKELSVSASGGSDVHYKGSGVIRNMHTSGSSSITRKG